MTAEIQGWFSHESGSMLYYLARERLPAPTIVELGSWKGRSTVWLAAAAADRGDTRVFAVDCWDGRGWPGYAPLLAGYRPGQLYDEFLQNLARAGVREIVTPLLTNL
jgi:MMP 1-O-methyltransferase